MGEDSFNIIWYALFAPLAGFLMQALLGKAIVARLGEKRGKSVMGWLAVLPVAVSFAIGAMITYALAQGGTTADVVLTLFNWIDLQSIRIPFEVRIDTLSMTMMLIVTGVGALIHLYATGYMAEDRDYTRFFTYMNLFIFCMLTLVLANNLAMLFIGWEGVGLCSYLLIGFWYKDIANAKAANKAFIVNRIGDVGLTLAMFLLITTIVSSSSWIGSKDNRLLSYDVLFPAILTVMRDQPVIVTLVGLLLFIGACGKSAQFPLYFWLPDAMAGPTPVSALIHAATMVTAGVFLVNRLHVVYEMSPVASAVVACVGAFTALFAALIAFGQTDIKKVLAYSTVSQLGFMFIGCGAGAYWSGIFHVTTHAFFKALLFLGAGAVIHCMMHNQDLRNYGNLRKYMPITFVTMMIAYLAIAGVPGFAGFFSKEAILGGALGNEHAAAHLGQASGWLGLFVAMLTAFYMTRMTALTFFGKERWKDLPVVEHHGHHDHEHERHETHEAHEDPHGFFMTDEEMAAKREPEPQHHELGPDHVPHEAPPSMVFPLIVLGVLSLAGGYVLEHVWHLKEWLYPQGLDVLRGHAVAGHPEGIPLMALSIGAATLGIIAGLIVYRKGLPEKEGWDLNKWSPFRRWAGNQFGYDQAVVSMGVDGGGQVGNALWKGFDAGVIDGIVNGLGWLAMRLSKVYSLIQTGLVRGYALLMLMGVVAILCYIVYAVSTGGAL